MSEAMYDLLHIIEISCSCIMYLTITIAIWVYLWKGRK